MSCLLVIVDSISVPDAGVLLVMIFVLLCSYLILMRRGQMNLCGEEMLLSVWVCYLLLLCARVVTGG